MRKTLLLILIVLAAGMSYAGMESLFSSYSSTDGMYLKASLYAQDGDYEEASRLLEAVLESENDAYLYLKLADVYQKLGDAEMVRFTLERGVRKLPESYVLLGVLADQYRMSGNDVELSYPLYQKAFKLSGDSAYAESEAAAHSVAKDYNGAIEIYSALISKEKKSDYFVNRARLYEKLGLENEAVDDYITAADIDDNFMAAAKLADYYIEKGNDGEAIKYLHKVLNASPDMTLAKFRLAVLLAKIGKTDEAEKYFTAILEFLNDKEKLFVLKKLANIAFENKNYDSAEQYFQKAFELDGDVQTAFSLAIVAESAGQDDIAVKWYLKILDKRPDFAEARKRLAILYLRKGESDKALAQIDKVEELFRDVTYYRIKAQAYTDKKDYASAEKVLEEAVKLNPAEVKLYIDLALAVDRQKDKKKSESVVKRGLKVFPDEPSLLNFLGYLYAEQGVNLDEAKTMISRALEQKPEEPAYIDSMGWVLYQQGKFDEAVGYLKSAAQKAPDEKEIIDHLKAVMKKLGIEKNVEEFLQD